MSTDVPAAVLAAYGLLEAELTPITIGLINRTYVASRDGVPFLVLQRLHPAFGAAVNEDIDVVTRHLALKGLVTPRLVRTNTGASCIEADGIYRALTYIHGRVYPELSSPALARAAGALAGSFHRAVADLEHDFAFVRPYAHDTPRHLATLREALEAHRDHPRFASVSEVAHAILDEAEALPRIPTLPPRIVHGDLKITNLLFHPERDEGLALVDLDTMAKSTLAIEMGDALRSWCNPSGESRVDAAVDPRLFEAALEGYATTARELLSPEERDSLVAGTRTIALELAARFCADALAEKYFGWDPTRFASRSEHSEVRARSQLALSRSVRREQDVLQRLVANAFR